MICELVASSGGSISIHRAAREFRFEFELRLVFVSWQTFRIGGGERNTSRTGTIGDS